MKLARLSWSWMNGLSNCGEQFRRIHLLKERRPPGFAMLRGRAVDDAVNANLISKLKTGEPLPPEAVQQAAFDAFRAATADGYAVDGEYEGMDPKAAFGMAQDEVVGLAGYHAVALAPGIQPEAIQLKVEIPPSEALPITWVGVLDLIDQTGVRDLKTKRKAPPSAMADDSDQLTGYDLLHRALKGKPPASLALDVLWQTPAQKQRKHVTLRTTRDERDVQVFVHRANAARLAIEAEIFIPAPTDSWICSEKFCGFTADCPYFRGKRRPTT